MLRGKAAVLEGWKAFFDVASAQGVYPKTLDPKTAYTLEFVGK